jgi:hypothetical protein
MPFGVLAVSPYISCSGLATLGSKYSGVVAVAMIVLVVAVPAALGKTSYSPGREAGTW